MIKLKNIFKEEVEDYPFDQPENNFLDYDELDVEDDDEEDFLNFLKSYASELQEANCNCVYEAEYQGREVKLGKPMQGDVKKFKVYVKNPKTGKVVKVNFGQKGMNIKKNNPERRKSFRARMNCDQPGPRTGARYWSCRKW
jgi:homospermidine synthase